MPFAIDEDQMNSPSLTMLDIGKPPVKSIEYQAYPKMVYLHPKDKTKEHMTRIVHGTDELASAEAEGWKTKPHIPEAPPIDLSGFHVEERRGPGRPAKVA